MIEILIKYSKESKMYSYEIYYDQIMEGGWCYLNEQDSKFEKGILSKAVQHTIDQIDPDLLYKNDYKIRIDNSERE